MTRQHMELRQGLIFIMVAALVSVAGCVGSHKAGPAAPSPSERPRGGQLIVSARSVTVWMASIFDLQSPKWTLGVLSGRPCGEGKGFCATRIFTAPNGRVIAFTNGSGALEVLDSSTHRTLLREPSVNTGTASAVGRLDVWFSQDGRLVARDMSILNNTGEVTISFQVWDLSTGQQLLPNGPSLKSPWLPIGAVGLQFGKPMILVLEDRPGVMGWYELSLTKNKYQVVSSYTTWREPSSIIYLSTQKKWFMDFGDSYATWNPSSRPRMVMVPCNTGTQASALDSKRDIYACSTGGTHAHGGDSTLIWDIKKDRMIAKFTDPEHVAALWDMTFVDNGRYLALLAEPRQNKEVVLSDSKLLITYSMGTHPVERSISSIPGVSGGWSVGSFGHYVFASGLSTGYGPCCFAVFSDVSGKASG